MANENKKAGTQSTALANSGLTDSDFVVHQGGVELIGEGGNWSALKSVDANGNSVPLVGWALRSEPRTSPKFKDFIAGIVEITQPTMVADGTKTYKQSDGVVSVTISVAKLADLQEVFDDPEYITKLQILAKGRKELPNGHTLQEYSVTALEKITRKEYEARKTARLQQLAAGNGASAPQLTT